MTAASLAILLYVAAPVTKIHYDQVPSGLKQYVPATAADFPTYVAQIDRESAQRVQEGEDEALIYFVLQSPSFTREPRVEPSISAEEYYARHELPAGVSRRFIDFLRALDGGSRDARMRYVQQMLPAGKRTPQHLQDAYARAMKFLHEKERETRSDVYESRGFSTDTRLAASYTIWNALGVLKSIPPELQIRRVLIVGPGIDFAPRMDYDERFPPQSYQPYAVADALLSMGLAQRESLDIDCVDVNDRVLAAIPARTMQLRIEPGTADFMSYEQKLQSRIEKALQVRVSATKLNIITERIPDPKYDLVIATNVLLYFAGPQLALALANIDAMMQRGGSFIHNDVRPETEVYTKELGLKWLQARRILVAQGRKAPLYDTFAILRK